MVLVLFQLCVDCFTRDSGMVTKTHFPFRIDVWDDRGKSIMQHVAGVDDFETAVATYWAAGRRPRSRFEKSWRAPFGVAF